MKKITAILGQYKLVDKLFDLKEKAIKRAIDAHKDAFETELEKAQLAYERKIKELGEPNNDRYSDIFNELVRIKTDIYNATKGLEFVKEIESDLDSDVEVEDQK